MPQVIDLSAARAARTLDAKASTATGSVLQAVAEALIALAAEPSANAQCVAARGVMLHALALLDGSRRTGRSRGVVGGAGRPLGAGHW